MQANQDTLRRVVTQHLRTMQLLGVQFVPVRAGARHEIASTLAASAASVSDAPSSLEPDSRDRDENLRLLEELRDRHDAECPHCTSVTTHTQTVFGEGHPAAQIMFIGEAPGEDEDLQGRPFVGRAGKKLDEIIHAMGLTREDVYIANVLKARPPNNRTPLPDEVARCSPFLVEQIRIIHPRVIVALGGPSAKLLLNTDTGITRLRGQWGVFHDGVREIPVMPTFHPAYLLRNYTRETRMQIWSDMRQVLARIGREPPART